MESPWAAVWALAQGSTLRIVGERNAHRHAGSRYRIVFRTWAPAIFLSRLPGALGPYLAFERPCKFEGADAVYCAFGRMCTCRQRRLAPLVADLSAIDMDRRQWRGCAALGARNAPAQGLPRTLFERACVPPSILISHTLPCPTSSASLDKESRVEYRDWAQQTATLMRQPLADDVVCVTLRQLQRGKSLDLAACFRMELGMVEQCFEQGDLPEGGARPCSSTRITRPRWKPSRLEEVTDASIDAFFRETVVEPGSPSWAFGRSVI